VNPLNQLNQLNLANQLNLLNLLNPLNLVTAEPVLNLSGPPHTRTIFVG
jgi:hypothetical protein